MNSSDKIFEDDRCYRRKEIRPKLGNVSDRSLDVILARGRVPRICLSRRMILYKGADLNQMLESAKQVMR